MMLKVEKESSILFHLFRRLLQTGIPEQNSVCETVLLTSGFRLTVLYQLRDLMKVCVFAKAKVILTNVSVFEWTTNLKKQTHNQD